MSQNNSMLTKAKVERLRQQYPEGTRVRLLCMDDPYTHIPKGTLGTVICVDDLGTIHTHWDTGNRLGLVYGEDSFEKISAPQQTKPAPKKGGEVR